MPVSVFPPWRSAWLPRVVTVVAIVAGLPLYLQSPLWCDVTLYDLAARNLLDGGIHYRDVFDTNLPGFVWLLASLRWLFGPDAIVIRLADLAAILAVVVMIDRIAKKGGASVAARWWAIAGIAFLYPFAAEMAHAQRDVWMMVPTLAAITLRLRRVDSPSNVELLSAPSTVSIFRQSALEGALWGLAVWLKPHVVPIAAATWLVTFRRLSNDRVQPTRAWIMDVAGNVVGGLSIGLCGVAWLVETKTWPGFWDVLTNWNPRYTRLTLDEFSQQSSSELYWFAPWSLWLLPTIPLAIFSVVDANPWANRATRHRERAGPVGAKLPAWLWDHGANEQARFVRGVLACLYLAWVCQALLIQRRFMYAHLPETLLMLGLWAAHRLAMPIIPLLWIALTSGLWLFSDANSEFRAKLLSFAVDKHASADVSEEHFIVRHPLADPDRMSCWTKCWRWELDLQERYALWDQLKLIRDHEASVSWQELEEVAGFLRKKNVKDREVIAWHDSPHAVYQMLGIKPGLRFVHTSTAQAVDYDQVQRELAATAGTARFAVGDLEWGKGVILVGGQELKAPCLPRCSLALLPATMNVYCRNTFPFNQPLTFRTRGGQGRYTVHELVPPFQDTFKQPK